MSDENIKWVPNISAPGWGHLEPFHDAECELIPAYIGEEIAKAFAAKDAEIERLRADSERYQILRAKACIIQRDTGVSGHPQGFFDFVNLPKPTYMAPDAARELDAALDAIRALKEGI